MADGCSGAGFQSVKPASRADEDNDLSVMESGVRRSDTWRGIYPAGT